MKVNVKGEGGVVVFSAKRWDPRSSSGLIESATPYHDAQVVGSYRGSNPFHLTVFTSKSGDYTTVPQNIQPFFLLDVGSMGRLGF